MVWWKGDIVLKKVELGCGASKTQGYIGIDRFELPEVDIVADLNKGIPLEDDSVDIIYMCHSLEHLDDFVYIMAEIYRVCKDGALVNILAPYQNTDLNIANPYHKLPLNEHTFRFVAKKDYTPLSPDEYSYSSAFNWALSRSDNSNPPFDMHCINFEFYYTEEYSNYPDELKRILRRSINNVCEQFYCNLVVVKDDRALSEDEVSMCLQRVEIENRLYRHPLRLREQEKAKKNTEPQNIIHFLQQELENQHNMHISQINESISTIKQQTGKFEVESKGQLTQIDESISTIMQETSKFEAEIKEQLTQTVDSISTIKQQTNKFKVEIKEQFTQTGESISAIKQQTGKIEADLRESIEHTDEVISLLQTQYLETYSELVSVKKSLMDVIRGKERKQRLYRKKWDFYPALKAIPIHTEFLDGIILKNRAFNKKSILALTYCLPFDRYVEYILDDISGESFNFFIIAGYNANLFVEFVQHGQIVKQEIMIIKGEGHQRISLGSLQGSFYVRFRVADNVSTVRLLEIRNRKRGIFYKSDLAAYGG